MHSTLNTIINSLQHPFFMLLGGLIFWFSLKWSWWTNDGNQTSFLKDQKDELIVSVIGGLLFLVWDDEILTGLSYVPVIKEYLGERIELQPFMYLLVGPAIERLYVISRYFKKKKDA